MAGRLSDAERARMAAGGLIPLTAGCGLGAVGRGGRLRAGAVVVAAGWIGRRLACRAADGCPRCCASWSAVRRSGRGGGRRPARGSLADRLAELSARPNAGRRS